MLRSASIRRCTLLHRGRYRQFHSTSRRSFDFAVENTVTNIAHNSFAFHSFFQLVHEFTTLPWLISIPLTTILVRAMVTPFRSYFAYKRRQQRLAEPELRLAAKIVETQIRNRNSAGRGSIEGNNQLKQKLWEAKRQEIEKKYPYAQPSLFMAYDKPFDIANVGAWAVVLINTSTILSVSMTIPEVASLNLFNNDSVLLSCCFYFLADLNTKYYHNTNQFKQHVSKRNASTLSAFSRDPLDWFRMNSRESLKSMPYLLPTALLVFSPTAVVLCALSNSVYTFCERKFIDYAIKLPERTKSLKIAVQVPLSNQKDT